jgi:hypothetical protein
MVIVRPSSDSRTAIADILDTLSAIVPWSNSVRVLNGYCATMGTTECSEFYDTLVSTFR